MKQAWYDFHWWWTNRAWPWLRASHYWDRYDW